MKTQLIKNKYEVRFINIINYWLQDCVWCVQHENKRYIYSGISLGDLIMSNVSEVLF